MKYIQAFRSAKLAKKLITAIQHAVNPKHHYRIMEFCGGHTHTIHRYGIPHILPPQIELIHGPGCPVCVLPIPRIDKAIALAQTPHVILCSYGDMLRVPGSHQHSLLRAKAQGADVRMVYSVNDALNIAKQNPDREVIFFAIGFETTTPPTAVALQYAKQQCLNNFYVFCNHVLTPPALEALLNPAQGEPPALDGFIGPAHVSIVIGTQGYEKISKTYQKPIVISGFEPLDLLQSILMLIQKINAKQNTVENQYTRAVTQAGNLKAQQCIKETLELRDTFEWRGLGDIPHSALKINTTYRTHDAEQRFKLADTNGQEHKSCKCGAILRGVKKPSDCKVFATVCTPENPLGSCMVSSEGACAAYYAYGRLQHDTQKKTQSHPA